MNNLPIQGAYNITAGLKRWRQSLGMTGKSSAGTGYGGIDICCWGDSILEGYVSSNVTFDSAAHYLKVKLQEKFNPSSAVGGYGYIPQYDGLNGGSTLKSLWTTFGTLTTNFSSYSMDGKSRESLGSNNSGANGMYCRLNGGNAAWMRTAADAVQYLGMKMGSYTSGRWDIGVGSAPAKGAGSQTGTHSQVLSSGVVHSGERYGAGTASSFTDKISLTASADNYIQWQTESGYGCQYNGIIAYNGDFDCGVRLHDLSFYGQNISSRGTYIRDMYNTATAGQFVTWGRGLLTGGACNAKLYIMDFISNDCGYNATPSFTLSSFITNYGLAIDYVLSLASKPSVLLVIPPMANDTALAARTTVGERWIDFRDAIYSLANARSNVAILDLSYYFDNAAISSTTGGVFDAGWYGGDHIHWSNTGQRAAGELMFRILTA